MKTPNNFSEYKDIFIIKLSSLGDIIHTLPAYSVLRSSFPEKSISWVVEKEAEQILELVKGLDRIITIDLKSKPFYRRVFWSTLAEVKSSMRQRKSIALDFQGLVKSGLISFLSKAEKRIGFHRKNLKEPLASLFYTHRLKPVSENMHVIRKNLKLLSLVGISEKRWDFPIRISPGLIESTQDKLKKNGINISKNMALFNIGGAWQTKRWFPDNWVKLIKMLDFKNLTPLVLWGNDEEKQTAIKISEKTGVAAVPFLTVKEVFALIHGSAFIVSGDSFPLHAASALSIPVVGIFGPTNPNRNGPFNKKDKIAFSELGCSYCYKHTCDKLDCLKRIKPSEVARLCRELLD